ncbi:MAG: hypothetical protein WAO75_00685 [Atribacterales bacterium]
MARAPLEKRVDKLEEALTELAQQSRVTELKLASFIQEMRDYREENNRMIREMKENTRIFEERMDKTIQDMNRKWGELANKMGTVTEDIVAPGFPFLIERHFGLSLDDISCRRKVKDKSGNRWEFDLVARSGNIAFIVDVKSDYNKVEYLDHFTQVLLPKAAELLPDLGGCKIIGCIASFRLDPSIIEKASQMGVLAISLGGDYLEFCNQEVVESIRETIRE